MFELEHFTHSEMYLQALPKHDAMWRILSQTPTKSQDINHMEQMCLNFAIFSWTSHGLTICRRGQRGWVHCVLGGSQRQGPWQSDPQLQRLALGTWIVTSPMGKESEQVCGVETFWLDIDTLTFTHSKGSANTFPSRGGLNSRELAMARGDLQGWQYLLPPGSVPIYWSLPSG